MTLCADPQVTGLVTQVFLQVALEGPTALLYKKLPEGSFPYSEVSSKGFDEKTKELSCSANLNLQRGGGLMGLDSVKHIVNYQVRPNLSSEGGILVEAAPAAGADDEAFYNALNLTIMKLAEDYDKSHPNEATQAETVTSGATEERAPVEDDRKASSSSLDNDPRIQAWLELEEQCRGGTDPTEVEVACAKRDEAVGELNAAGLCHGKRDQFASEYEWHRCGPDSNL